MSLLAAIAFLTVLPLPRSWKLEPRHLARATPWYPMVGLLLGGVLAGSDWALGQIFAPPARDALVLVEALLLSGALHLDGLMDTCDGYFAAVEPRRRLEIMRDSHVGSFGVAGAALVLLGKWAALASLGETPRWAALIAMAVLGRWAMTLAVVALPAGRPDGLGWLVKAAARRGDLLLGGLLALLPVLVGFGIGGGLLWVGVSVLALGAGYLLCRRLPGLTGDSYGALDELAELAALILTPVCLGFAGRLTGAI